MYTHTFVLAYEACIHRVKWCSGVRSCYPVLTSKIFKSSSRDKGILFMEELVRDLKTENSDNVVSYKNDAFFNMYKNGV